MSNWRRIAIGLALAAVGAMGPAAGAAAHPAPASDVGELLSRLEGGWSGGDNPTPMGPMEFTLLFERRDDGSLAARTSLNRETYVDLAFAPDAGGRWLLHEEAGMEGLGVQRYTLTPVGAVGANHRWVYAERPDFLWVDVGVNGEGDGDSMLLEVRLRGERHVRFELDRLPAEELPALRRELALRATQSPAEGLSIGDLVAGRPAAAEPGEAAAIDAGRQAVAESPADGAAHLRLARALGAAIEADPGNGPRYGAEMLAALRRAIELDPRLNEAYHWLAGYYLNAPPVAGGSLEMAEQTARRLAEFDPAGAEGLLREIAARRGDR